MPYDPKAYSKPTEEENRSRLYWLVWFSFACNLLLLLLYFFDISLLQPLVGVMIGSVIGGLINGLGFGRTDDYYRSLADSGRRWLLGGIIGLSALAFFGHLTPSLVPAQLLDGDIYLISLMGALLYHSGYAFAWVRDNGLRSGEEAY